MNSQESMQLVGLIVTTLSSLIITPLKDLPIIDFSDIITSETQNPTVKKFSIVVSNYGMGPAKNVLVSITGYNARFFNFSSEPFLLSTYFKVDNVTMNQTGHGFFEIDTLPSGAQLNATGYMDISKSPKELSLEATIFSDKVIGYRNWHKDFINYSIVTFLVIASGLVLFLRIYYYYRRQNIERV
jgi:hypothetical protein